jgi:hypothetical protein
MVYEQGVPMSISTTHRTTREADADERRRRVEQLVHSGEMEGLRVTDATRADAEEYIAGSIDSDELLERVQTRYGVR